MPISPERTTYFKQARFATRLPNEYLYSPAHYWISPQAGDTFRVGLTKFAARMLGDFVEFTVSVQPGDKFSWGEAIGSLEGFKAIAEVYAVGTGALLRCNSEIERQPEWVDKDPYDRGWLYEFGGQRREDWLTVDGYVALLDATIAQMLAVENRAKDASC